MRRHTTSHLLTIIAWSKKLSCHMVLNLQTVVTNWDITPDKCLENFLFPTYSDKIFLLLKKLVTYHTYLLTIITGSKIFSHHIGLNLQLWPIEMLFARVNCFEYVFYPTYFEEFFFLFHQNWAKNFVLAKIPIEHLFVSWPSKSGI